MPETGLYINAVVFMSIQQAQKNPVKGFVVVGLFPYPASNFKP